MSTTTVWTASHQTSQVGARWLEGACSSRLQTGVLFPWSPPCTASILPWVCAHPLSACHRLAAAAAVTAAGLRDLTLRGNRDVTDAALATVVKHMHQLAFLDLCHTGVSKAGVALLRQLPLRQLKLCGIKDLVDEVDESVCPRYCRYCSASCPYKDGV